MTDNLNIKECSTYLSKPIFLNEETINLDISVRQANLTLKGKRPIIDVISENLTYDTTLVPMTKHIEKHINDDLMELLSTELTDHFQGRDYPDQEEFRSLFIPTLRRIFHPYERSIQLIHLEKTVNQLLRQEMINLATEELQYIMSHPDAHETHKVYKTEDGPYCYQTTIIYDERTETLHVTRDDDVKNRFAYYNVGNVTILFDFPDFSKG